MSIELQSLQRKIERLEGELIDKNIALNQKSDRIRKLERQLEAAMREVRKYEDHTQRNLAILDYNADKGNLY